MPFYIDEIKVTQSLPKGSQTFTEVENKTLTGKESSNVRFTGMEAAEKRKLRIPCDGIPQLLRLHHILGLS